MSASFSWQDTLRAYAPSLPSIPSCLPLIPCLPSSSHPHLLPSSDSTDSLTSYHSSHPNQNPTSNRPPPPPPPAIRSSSSSSTDGSLLRPLLFDTYSDTDTNADTVSLRSDIIGTRGQKIVLGDIEPDDPNQNVNPTRRRRRRRKESKQVKGGGWGWLSGIREGLLMLVGGGGSRRTGGEIQLPLTDDEGESEGDGEGDGWGREMGRNERRVTRSRRVRTTSEGTLDSDAAPLDDEAIGRGVGALLMNTGAGVSTGSESTAAAAVPAPPSELEELRQKVRDVEREERKRRRREKREMERASRAGLENGGEAGGEGKFEGFQGSGGGDASVLVMSSSVGGTSSGRDMIRKTPRGGEDEDDDEDADLDGVVYARNTGAGSAGGAGSDSKSRTTTSATSLSGRQSYRHPRDAERFHEDLFNDAGGHVPPAQMQMQLQPQEPMQFGFGGEGAMQKVRKTKKSKSGSQTTRPSVRSVGGGSTGTGASSVATPSSLGSPVSRDFDGGYGYGYGEGGLRLLPRVEEGVQHMTSPLQSGFGLGVVTAGEDGGEEVVDEGRRGFPSVGFGLGGGAGGKVTKLNGAFLARKDGEDEEGRTRTRNQRFVNF
ncbi:hypothetical protein AMATHDRAFT_50297 [Amanita thiersii Skay4041]|uniref:Uncharacterized protein n=1 Tax=Amanita thiersii Skay4041 TaxID=703135 RepID=A0A2A9NIE4_9AGAR|nr:hypothetical protein AMATHDRAFT_50297 [Amanita thiersii Skay4041]